MTAEPQPPKPRGRTATGRIPDQAAGARLVEAWAEEADAEEKHQFIKHLVTRAYEAARL